MKKIILILLVCFCFMFAGCSSYAGMTLVVNSNGEISEKYFIPFPRETIISLTGDNLLAQQKMQTLISNIQNDINNEVFSPLLSRYRQRINASTKYSDEKKNELISGVSVKNNFPSANVIIVGDITSIEYQIDFASSECYNAFKDTTELIKENKQVQEIVSLFTTTTKVTKDPLFDKIVEDTTTIGNNMINIAQQEMIDIYGEYVWNELKQALSFDEYSQFFTFTYVVPTSRLHSNADKVTERNGYYQHQWKVPANNLDENGESVIKFEYWQITPNRWVWYVVSLAGAVAVVLGTFMVYKSRQKLENQNAKKQEQSFKVEE